ncbi:MAG TPA: ABC transporter ATP-binding protein [Candidatus Deferrimicrobiaceae bacterium]|nr:ABC transporter ATP-binding protein [Candidatus Deferrimicrobiaceae bacterium]
MNEEVLAASALTFGYGERDVLAGVDLRVREGEVAILLGPNGAGKSTLLKLFSGVLRPHGGELTVLGRPPSSYARREMARILSVVGQDPPLDFPMSVEEYVMLGRFPHQGFFGQPTAEDRREVDRALSMTSLPGLRARGLGEISAGERQRAAVARAIAQGAKVMLLDEPTAFLDIYHRVAFYEVVTLLSESCGVTALIASHDLSLCAEYGERIILLSGGTVRASGHPGEVLTAGNIREAFGVDAVCDRNPSTGAIRVTPVRRGREKGEGTIPREEPGTTA